MSRSKAIELIYHIGILYLLSGCNSSIVETEATKPRFEADDTLIQTITEPILLSKVDTPLHW